jgi:hypothetical protein
LPDRTQGRLWSLEEVKGFRSPVNADRSGGLGAAAQWPTASGSAPC